MKLARVFMLLLWGALLAAGPGAAPARAELTEEDFLGELPVVLSATRLVQPVAEAPASVTLIDRQMIEASGFRDLPELLRLVPGFAVAYTRDNTWTAGYHGLADAYSRRFQVLVDGRSIYSPHYGTVYWTDLPLAIEDIERIEVVRGPNAAIHGANAFVAVINLITRTAAQASGKHLAVQLGEAGTRGLVARVGGGERLRYRLTVSRQQRDRFERDVDYKIPISGDNGAYFEATRTAFVNGRCDWQLTPGSDFMAQFGLSDGDWRAGRDVARPDAVLEPRTQDSMAGYLQLAWHAVERGGREWRLQAYHSLNRFDADIVATLAPGAVVVDQALEQTRSNLELQVNEPWSPALRGVWGLEVRRETVKSPQNYSSDRTYSGTLQRAFGHLEWRVADWLLAQGGAMLEHHFITGTDVSPRASLNVSLAPNHTLRLGVSSAYRTPTFFEQYGNRALPLTDGSIAYLHTIPADAPLAPERIVSRDIGYVARWPGHRLDFDARLFVDRIDDFLGQQRITDPPVINTKKFQYQNIGSVRSRGGEVELRWQPGRFNLTAHYARVFLSADTRYVNYNNDIPQSAPRASGGLLGEYRLDGGWRASLGYRRSDPVKWLTEGDLVPSFSRLDARVARRWNWRGTTVEAALTGQALTGDYYEFRDTNRVTPRVAGSLAVSWP